MALALCITVEDIGEVDGKVVGNPAAVITPDPDGYMPTAETVTEGANVWERRRVYAAAPPSPNQGTFVLERWKGTV